ncbi:MAG: antitoxin [Lachnospiraceae bacterium]|nr:antitoxin [Lachnospiraceae bacterium]MBR4414952.1 hypothetical protein [Aeriscardovia sp.]
MAIIKKTIDRKTELTQEQLEMLKEAENTPYVYDEDNQILTKEELSQFRRVSDIIKEERKGTNKQNITLRLSPRTISKAKMLGKGYTSILAKIIEKALDNPELTEILMK